MSDFVLVTDGACDLPEGALGNLGFSVIPMNVMAEGDEPTDSDCLSAGELYADLRAGRVYKTAAISVSQYKTVFGEILKAGQNLLYLCFSSGLSSTYRNATLAARAVEAKYPERRAVVIDTLAASAGLGYLAVLAARKKAEGARLDEVAAYLEDMAPRIAHQFTVNDLFYLKKGGKLSSATALLGTVLQYKPVLHMDEQGRLTSVGKVRGRKAALETLVSRMEATLDRERTEFVHVCHGDCLADAEELAALITERFGYTDVTVCDIGATIGVHAGPDTLALFYVATER